ncbi:MAG: glucan biosynthesis protein [Puniceicoccales bacterium]|jgi:glucans biosynthesis protein|nr:glucan biosynthesis protein [Puniceicoccales bacterium]
MLKKLLLGLILCGFVTATAQVAEKGKSFSYDNVVAEAKALFATTYVPESERVPRFYLELFYDQFRQIRFLPEKSIWTNSDSPWRIQFFHPGLYFNRIAKIYTVESGVVREIAYDPSRFEFGSLGARTSERPAGHAGFRLHGEVNQKDIWDEFAVFVGASYFRLIPTQVGATYGLSARGIAINTSASGVAEDFPFFKKFWIERKANGENESVVYALMDSPNVCGAYKFNIRPGKKTITEVEATVFFRESVDRVGLAPFSSMYWYGENSLKKPSDFRPEVHDSDGVIVQETTGRTWWRPISIGRETRHSSFEIGQLKGFGVRQRDLSFASYQDLEAWYHKRPGVWVEPLEGWPNGAVHIIELPTSEEVWDNVVCYWQPNPLPAKGAQLHFRYRITWALESEFPTSLSKVTATHIGKKTNEPKVFHHVIDFSPIPNDTHTTPPQLKASVSGAAKLKLQNIFFNPETQGWRVVLDAEPVSAKSTYEMKAVLVRDDREVSENWDYLATAAPE